MSVMASPVQCPGQPDLDSASPQLHGHSQEEMIANRPQVPPQRAGVYWVQCPGVYSSFGSSREEHRGVSPYQRKGQCSLILGSRASFLSASQFPHLSFPFPGILWEPSKPWCPIPLKNALAGPGLAIVALGPMYPMEDDKHIIHRGHPLGQIQAWTRPKQGCPIPAGGQCWPPSQ